MTDITVCPSCGKPYWAMDRVTDVCQCYPSQGTHSYTYYSGNNEEILTLLRRISDTLDTIAEAMKPEVDIEIKGMGHLDAPCTVEWEQDE